MYNIIRKEVDMVKKSKRSFHLVTTKGEFPVYEIANTSNKLFFRSLKRREIVSLRFSPSNAPELTLADSTIIRIQVVTLTALKDKQWQIRQGMYGFEALIYPPDPDINEPIGLVKGTFNTKGFPGYQITGPVPVIFEE